MRIPRTLRRGVAWLIATVTLIGTGPTIWHDAIANIQIYLHTSRTSAMAIALVPMGAILALALLRARKSLQVRRQHRAVRRDALRNLRV